MTKVFMRSDSTKVAVVSEDALHYADEGGKWQDIDNSLKTIEKDGKEYLTNRKNDFIVELPKNFDNHSLVKVKDKNYEVSFKLLGDDKPFSRAAKEVKTEDTINEYNIKDKQSEVLYKGGENEYNIEYSILPEGLKESIILNKASSKAQKYSYEIISKNLIAVLNDDNSIDFFQSNAKNKAPVFTMPSPYMFDSAEDSAVSYDIKTTLSEKNGKYILTYEPDFDWLSDKERVYPITIDPTLTRHSSSAISASYRSVTGTSYVTSPITVGSTTKAVISWTLPDIDGGVVTKATMNTTISAVTNVNISLKEVLNDSGGASYTVSSTVSDYHEVKPSQTEYGFDISGIVSNAYFAKKTKMAVELSQEPTSYPKSTITASHSKFFVIEFSNIEGIAPSISYHTQGIGRAGTSYVNDINGKLVISRNDIGAGSNVLPVDIGMFHNNKTANDSPYGNRWNCNYFYQLTSVMYDSLVYKLTDGSGRKIYLEKSTDNSLIYYDENGEGYELKFASVAYSIANAQLTTPDGQIFSFDSYGRVVKIEDASFKANGATNAINISFYGADTTQGNRITQILDGIGRKYTFNYNADNQLDNISYYGTGSTVLNKVSYTYTTYMNTIYNLTKVTYYDGKYVQYEYSGGVILNKAIDVDGYNISYTYSGSYYMVHTITEKSGSSITGGILTAVYGYRKNYFFDNRSPKNEEYLSYDKYLNVTSVRNQKGQNVSMGYEGRGVLSKVSNVNSSDFGYITSNNLVANADFTNGFTGWTKTGLTASDTVGYNNG